jgi:hypothetical protein
MSANEFLTRVNLMRGRVAAYETPLPVVKDKKVIVIGGGNTAMDAARTALRLRGDVTIVYRRTRAEIPARVEELLHALEEGVKVKELRAPRAFQGNSLHQVCQTLLDVMDLGPPDAPPSTPRAMARRPRARLPARSRLAQGRSRIASQERSPIPAAPRRPRRSLRGPSCHPASWSSR